MHFVRTALCAILFLASFTVAERANAAVTLAFANLAPRAADDAVAIEVDGRRVAALRYGEFAPATAIAAGEPLVVATAGDGTVLASARVRLVDGIVGTLAIVGNGVGAPFDVALSLDHNHPILQGAHTIQTFNAVAPVRADDTSTVGEQACPGPVEVAPVPLAYRAEFLDEGARAAVECFAYALPPSPTDLATAAFQALAGGRYRVWLVGDGLSRPLQTIVQAQGIEPQLGTAVPSAAMDGLWFDPADPGQGYAITYNASAVDTQVQAIHFGFDAETGAPNWDTVVGAKPVQASEPTFGVEYFRYFGSATQVGGDARRESRGMGTMVFHSCTQATLFVGAGPPVFGPHMYPRDAVRLTKLLPLGGCSNPQFG